MTNATDSPLIRERWISLCQAAKLFPPARRGRPVSGSCVFRWHRDGVRTADGRRVYLEALRVVNRLVTSEAAVQRFVLAQQSGAAPAAPNEPSHPAPRTPGQRARASERAASELKAQGV
jgi:hypothetical protein